MSVFHTGRAGTVGQHRVNAGTLHPEILCDVHRAAGDVQTGISLGVLPARCREKREGGRGCGGHFRQLWSPADQDRNLALSLTHSHS